MGFLILENKMKIQKLIIFLLSGGLFAACTNSLKNLQVTVPEKKIVQILVQGNEDEYKYHYILEYDEKGRITKVEPDYPEIFGTFFCEYSTDAFRMGKGDIHVSGSLNEQGYIQSAEDFAFEEMFVGNMTYNNKGQLISIQHPEAEEITFTWKNDDMVQLNVMDKQINIAYTSLENKNNLGFLLTIDKENCTPVFPYYTLLGKPSKHLPQSIRQGEQVVNYQYTTDNDGYIKEMTMIYSDNSKTIRYSFVYE